jgi:hypothetical protein
MSDFLDFHDLIQELVFRNQPRIADAAHDWARRHRGHAGARIERADKWNTQNIEVVWRFVCKGCNEDLKFPEQCRP